MVVFCIGSGVVVVVYTAVIGMCCDSEILLIFGEYKNPFYRR